MVPSTTPVCIIVCAVLTYPAYLLGISEEALQCKLISRVMDSVWGGKTERVEVTFNQEKAQFARDAWAKGLYARLFEHIVQVSSIKTLLWL